MELTFSIPFSLVSIILFVGFGLLFGTLFNVKTVGGIASILIICQSLLSGMWFPLDKLSDGFNRLIEVLPFRSGTLLFQNISMASNDILKPFFILLLYTVMILIIAIKVYNLKMKEN